MALFFGQKKFSGDKKNSGKKFRAKKNFWAKIFHKDISDINKFNLYKKIKLFLRFEIIKNLKKNFHKQLNLIGNDWNFYSFNSLPSNYNIKKNKKLYEGNICLDLGCIEGSSSLYSRSNQIIESGGLIIQSFQCDGKNIWGNLLKT